MEFRTRFASWDIPALLRDAPTRETSFRTHGHRRKEATRNTAPQQPQAVAAVGPAGEKPRPPRSQ